MLCAGRPGGREPKNKLYFHRRNQHEYFSRTGAVSALQTAYQRVSPVIPLSTIAQIVRDTVILEFSPTLVCIVLAGVVGSKIASELGNMRVSEQIDALEIMGINTKSYLIFPKLLASVAVIPM